METLTQHNPEKNDLHNITLRRKLSQFHSHLVNKSPASPQISSIQVMYAEDELLHLP